MQGLVVFGEQQYIFDLYILVILYFYYWVDFQRFGYFLLWVFCWVEVFLKSGFVVINGVVVNDGDIVGIFFYNKVVGLLVFVVFLGYDCIVFDIGGVKYFCFGLNVQGGVVFQENCIVEVYFWWNCYCVVVLSSSSVNGVLNGGGI